MRFYPVKQRIERILTDLGLYAPFKSSPIYEAYIRIIRPEIVRERALEIDFYRSLLRSFGDRAVVFDVGANVGDKAEVFRRTACCVVCCEPDASGARFLRQRFARDPKVTVLESAVSETEGTLTFLRFEGRSALNTVNAKWAELLCDQDHPRFERAQKPPQSVAVTSVTLDGLIARYGVPSYVKIDVEGHENVVLRGLTRKVPLLSFEVNLPEFREEALDCIACLEAIHPAARFNYTVGTRATHFGGNWISATAFAQWLRTTRATSFDVFVDNRFVEEMVQPIAALAS
jgi:FkbM family methyltransferase